MVESPHVCLRCLIKNVPAMLMSIATLGALLWLCPVSALAADEAKGSPPGEVGGARGEAAGASADPGTLADPDALSEEDSQRPAADQGVTPVTVPKTQVPGRRRPVLSADGTMLIDRRCSVEHDPSTGWALLVFADEPPLRAEPPRWALPCELLEAMEAAAARQAGAMFRVSGENTVYKSWGFLLLRKVTVEYPSPAPSRPLPAPEKPAASSAGRPTAQPAAPSPATRPAAASAPAGTRPTRVSSDDVIEQLLRDKPGKPVIVPVQPPADKPSTAPSVAPATAAELSSGRGRFVASRIVRLLPVGIGQWMEVRFESDNTLQEPPVRMLPCALLEKAEKAGGNGRRELSISGELTTYQGRQYFLLRRVLVEHNMGQF